MYIGGTTVLQAVKTSAQVNWQSHDLREIGTAQGWNKICEHEPNALLIGLSVWGLDTLVLFFHGQITGFHWDEWKR